MDLLILMILMISSFEERPSDFEAPKIWIESLNHDLGTIRIHSTALHALRIENRGRSILLLRDIKLDRGLALAEGAESAALKPGDALEFQIAFTPDESGHEQTRRITFLSNDPMRRDPTHDTRSAHAQKPLPLRIRASTSYVTLALSGVTNKGAFSLTDRYSLS